jgi:ADP-ribose pyrophosphatase
MQITRRETLYTGEFIRLVKKSFQGERGAGFWEMIEWVGGDMDAVVIVAITREREIILERNWRIPIESYVIQLPAGLIDGDGETEEEAARRELLEETGYLAHELIPIMKAPQSPSILPYGLSHYLAPDVEYVGKENRDTAEQIEVIKVPLSRLPDYLLNLPADTGLDLRVTGLLWFMEKRGLLTL